jgi:hypothetical protein
MMVPSLVLLFIFYCPISNSHIPSLFHFKILFDFVFQAALLKAEQEAAEAEQLRYGRYIPFITVTDMFPPSSHFMLANCCHAIVVTRVITLIVYAI